MPPLVSLCMIVKNEEANLPACLGSTADLVNEIIVVDTGSTDRTREVAAGFGARVANFPWVDSFAAARNESIRHAAGEWIFWMDADDRLDAVNRERLRSVFASLHGDNAAYMMRVQSLPRPGSSAVIVVDHARLFRNHPQLRWQYRVHEQITSAVERLGGSLRRTDVIVHHAGYQDAELRNRKNERNLRLLLLDAAEQPDDPITLFHLGWTYLDLGRPAEALPHLRRSLERSPMSLSSTSKTYALLMNTYYALGQKAQSLAACREGRLWFPTDAELLFAEGKLLLEAGDLRGAEDCLLRLLGQGLNEQPWGAVDVGVYSYLARFHLGESYSRQGRAGEAEAQWQAVLNEQPDFVQARLALGGLYLAQRRWVEVDRVLQGLETDPRSAVDAVVLKGSALRIRGEFAAARQLLQQTIARYPQAIGPRLILSHVLLAEGRDLAAAEKALYDVLTLDPQNADARHNLAVFQQRTRPQGPTR